MSMLARRWMLLPVAVVGVALCSLVAMSHAQDTKKASGPPPKPDYDEFNLTTHVGSFKMLEFNDDKQPEGHFEMTFTGTVLVDTSEATKHSRGLSTTIRTEGNVKLEKEYHGRKAYFGTGKIVVDGGWHALQWFGRDMTGKFLGCGVFRLSGEFDKDLNTGSYWYKDGKKVDWGTGGQQPTVPASVYGIVNPKVNINGKGG